MSSDCYVESFQYGQPLQPVQIRLLSIDSISDDGLPYCTLRTVSRESCLEYCALSYCWGADPPDLPINVNGGLFRITPSLLAAIKALHAWFKAQEAGGLKPKPMWIDAVCIDQSNNEEKSHQVQQMDCVFRQASEVLVWLGEHADDSKRAMAVIMWLDLSSRLHKLPSGEPITRAEAVDNSGASETTSGQLRRPDLLSQRERQATTLKKTYDITQPTLDAFEALLSTLGDHYKRTNAPMEGNELRALVAQAPFQGNLFGQDDVFWIAFLKLAGRPWFCRLWTLQEIVLSKHALVFCGSPPAPVRWETLRDCLHLLLPAIYIGVLYPVRTVVISHGSIDHFLMSVEGSQLSTRLSMGPRYSFGDILYQTSARKAQDPRDLIFGVLGLCDKAIRAAIPVDYRFSAAAVFANALRVACQVPDGPLMWVLLMESCDPTASTRPENLPSWCPDFSSRRLLNLVGLATEDSSVIPTLVGAARDRGHLHFNESFSALSVRGVQLDTVHKCLAIASERLDLDDLTRRLRWRTSPEVFALTCKAEHIEWLDQLHRFFILETGRGSARSEAWLNCSMRDDDPDRPTPFEQKYNIFLQWLDFFKAAHATGSQTWEETATRMQIEMGKARDLLQSCFRFRFENASRYFFITTEGRVGYSAHPIMNGCRICYFPGGTFLHVLSAKGDRHIMFALLAGFKQNVFLQMLPDLEDKWETFRLVK